MKTKISLIIGIIALILQLYLGFFYNGEYVVGGLYLIIGLLWSTLILKRYDK